MIVQEPGPAEAGRVTVWLRPNRALSKRHLRWLVVGLAAASLGTAWLGSFQGNVYAPLFALVEVQAVAFALGLAWRAGDRGERITLDADALEVCAFPGRGGRDALPVVLGARAAAAGARAAATAAGLARTRA
ncbi:MAG: DUF2244 domain-containing protein [Mizugakiibacter sp.]|uniref:DUF2244 domain-containing protein n=1 Tax=Mizugakiibacter sp. TaxID=1972610 RepID=UPI0032103E94